MTVQLTLLWFNRDEVKKYKAYLEGTHDSLLSTLLAGEDYVKLYSYVYTVNGFAALLTNDQVIKKQFIQLDCKLASICFLLLPF